MENHFILEVDGMLTKLNFELAEKPGVFNVEYPGLMLEITCNEALELHVTNGVDGWGNNVREKYISAPLKCYI